MQRLADDRVWRQRLSRIPTRVESIDMPKVQELEQDEEWCHVVVDGERRRLRFHDYGEIFDEPGLYEKLFYEELECCSPSYLSRLLDDVIRENGADASELRVLDVGAGNGMVGEELREIGIKTVVGVDIEPSAKTATLRDRPGVYHEYEVIDLTQPRSANGGLEGIADAGLNCLTTVAALGYGDIPPEAFLNALRLISTPGWVAFNLKEDFLRERDTTGFSQLIRQLSHDDVLRVYCYRRYRHRNSLSGRPLHYVAMVARKLRDPE